MTDRPLKTLADIIARMATSAAHFDRGDHHEAPRLATDMRLLFHDTPKLTSIMTLLGQRATNLRLVNSAATTAMRDLEKLGLGPIKLKPQFEATLLCYAGAEAHPKFHFNTRGELVAWKDWWSYRIFFGTSPPKIEVLRRDLVLAMANKDGGVHLDKIAGWYRQLSRSAGAPGDKALTVRIGNAPPLNEEQMSDHHLKMVRQLAWEVLVSPDIQELAKTAS